VYPHLSSQNMGQGGLAKPRRAVEQNVFKCFTALLGCCNLNLQVLLHLLLTYQVTEGAWPQGNIRRVIWLPVPSEDAVILFRAHCRNYTRFRL